ncbi:transporter [Nesterenkonia sp. HG001]|uniref:transporter n=1 Tax=Nesterenkonia sp. HG001 TaxID=2983207 RepID=UPI002AC6B576|nr:transporter [Nesterenkonia sp. HG001]MDZ5078623.1 transporter [Nesterenkonia sp. HG001]
MVATLIRLKLALAANSFRRSAWQVVGTLFMLLYGLGMTSLLVTALVVSGSPAAGLALETRHTVSVLLGAAVLLLWLLIPLFLTGRDSLMDPRHFVTTAVPRRSLVTGLVLCGLLSLGALLTVVWLLGHVLYWRAEPAAMITAAVSAPILLVTFSLVSQAVTTTASAWLDGRRFRDLMAVTGLGLAILVWPASTLVQDAFGSLAEALPTVTRVISYTPLGAGTALPGDVAAGDWGGFLIHLLILAGTAGAAVLVIRAGLVKITERPGSATVRRGAAQQGRLGLFALLPDRPWAAVAARALTYWLKDPRYGGSLVVVPGLVILVTVMHLQTGQTGFLYALGPFLAFTLGFAISADVAYDHTAFSLHVTSGVRGIDDRFGRAFALLVFALPATLLAAVIPALIAEGAMQVLLTTGLSLGALFTAVGVSLVVSARFTYPVPRPGESPFKQPQGAMGRVMAVQLLSMLAIVVLMIPELAGWIAWLVVDIAWIGVLTGILAVLKGAALLTAGLVLGARIYDRSQPELFQQVRAHA